MTSPTSLADDIRRVLADAGFRITALPAWQRGAPGIYVEAHQGDRGAYVLWNGAGSTEEERLRGVLYRALQETLSAYGFEVMYRPGTPLRPPELTVTGQRQAVDSARSCWCWSSPGGWD